jgi:molecular chaperone DnaK (HSP70)
MRTKECLFVPFMRLNRLLCAVATYHHRLQETSSSHNNSEQHKDKLLQAQKQTREETKRRMKTMRLMIGVFESIQDKSLDRVQGNLSQEQLNRRRQLNKEVKQCLEQLQLEMERSKCTLSAM